MSPADVPAIGDYAIVGDTRTAALVARDGAVDWLCLPRFDSDAVLCRILDPVRGGTFQVSPGEPCTSRRAYRDGTAVLETTFAGASGAFRVVDLMPVGDLASARGPAPRLLRVIEGLSGDLPVRAVLRPTPGFAQRPARVSLVDGGAVAHAGEDSVALATDLPLRVGAGAAAATFRIRAGERRWLALSPGASVAPVDAAGEPARTEAAWRSWLSGCSYEGPHRSAVLRSVVTLKLLTCADTGALLAAPTTSLPEELGGVRNWDYRFTWLRDAALVLDVLMALGLHGEAMAFWGFLERLGLHAGGAFRILYGIDGRADVPERTLDHLAGHRSSRPVRVGNLAGEQRQLDVPGYVLDAAELCQRRMRTPHPTLAPVLRHLADVAAARWREPDAGIWEVRGGPRQFVHSKVMTWVALDRAARLAARGWLRGDVSGWRAAAADVRADVLSRGWDARVRAFTRSYGEEALDATALLMPRVGFVPPWDERWRSTVKEIRERLTSGGLVYRYRAPDGVAGREGTFTACTYWLAEALALLGEADAAHRTFERVTALANDVGLLAEEIDPATGEQLGNFPQAFSHLALVHAALALGDERQGRRRRLA